MLAFAHIQKSAGTSFSRILRQSFGFRHCVVHRWYPLGDYFDGYYDAQDHRRTMRLLPGLVSIASHQVKPYSDLSDAVDRVQYVTFLREPLARTASHYQHMAQRLGYPEPFGTFYADVRMHDLQCKHLVGRADGEAAIQMVEQLFFVGLTEHFDESLVLFQRLTNDPRLDIRYERQNVARDVRIKNSLMQNPEIRQQLEAMNENDARLYTHVRERLYPRYQAEFGSDLDEAVARFRATNKVSRWQPNVWVNRFVRNTVYRPALKLAPLLHRP